MFLVLSCGTSDDSRSPLFLRPHTSKQPFRLLGPHPHPTARRSPYPTPSYRCPPSAHLSE
ncbi:hypothetical protein BDZ89DRAFT_467244 [Hymenopellis radicata]|nr:hypothetical protein BDZ89DRAFT_467244 [Hymenopellis radicata]